MLFQFIFQVGNNFPYCCLISAVVGGGIGGASSAYFLRKMFGNKVSITLFEKSGRIGGRIKAVPFCGETCESGASAIHSSNHYMTSFANQFSKLVCIFPEYFVNIIF